MKIYGELEYKQTPVSRRKIKLTVSSGSDLIELVNTVKYYELLRLLMVMEYAINELNTNRF